tara:strand:+ start:1378 stop:1767 length:390 start_codon:yes stop_codon:yes gene_type:complete
MEDARFNVEIDSDSLEKTIIGFYEDIIIGGREVRAKIDTGASVSSIDSSLAEVLKAGPVVSRTTIVNAHGRDVRPVVRLEVEMGGKKMNARFNVAARGHMRYQVLIGKNILRKGFIIDPKKRLKKKAKD